MDITTLGSLGEFIGSIAVLLTLVYLALQTRDSVKAARQRSHADIINRRQELQLLIVQQPEFNDVLSRAAARESLTSLEAQQFTSFMMSYLTHTQDAWTQYKAGLIDRDIWEAELTTIRPIFTQAGFLDWWAHGKQFLTPGFVEMIETAPSNLLVLYDPQTQTWGRPEDGVFGKDARSTD